MKNQKKQNLSLKKLSIAKLQPGIIGRLKGGNCTTPNRPSGNPCHFATGDPCEYPD